MGYAVKQDNYQTCICGKICKGRAALANHGRKCAAEQVRSALAVWLAGNGNQHVSDSYVLRNLPEIAERLIELSKLHGSPISGMLDNVDLAAIRSSKS